MAEVLSYASNPPRHAPLLLRHFHVWVLPLIWLPGSWGSRIYYGDEFVAFAIANLPTALVCAGIAKLVRLPEINGEGSFWMVVAAGFVIWCFVGWLLDRVRAWRWIYLLMPLAFFAIVKSRIAAMGSVQPTAGPAHPPGQEWEWPSVFVAYCWAVYLVAVAILIGSTIAALIRVVVHKVRRRAGDRNLSC